MANSVKIYNLKIMNLVLFLANIFILLDQIKSRMTLEPGRVLQNGLSSSPGTPTGAPSMPTSSLSSSFGAAGNSNAVISCNQEMMLSYGLTGYNTAQVSTHKYCPMITQNCCTPEDETKSLQLWNNQLKYVIERYYEVYLYSIKYVLGFSQEVYLLAQEYTKSENQACKAASDDFIAMNFNVQITKDVYNSYVKATEKMGDLRRGFYCIMCDGKTQAKLKDFWSASNLFYKDRIYFSQDFCKALVEETIRASYFTVYYLKRFADNMGKLINCKTGNSTNLEYEIPFWTKQQVKNCYYFKNKNFFFFCENYCESFHLTKAGSMLDGDLTQLRKFVDHLVVSRQQAFKSPGNNILMDGVGFEEDYLKYYYKEVEQDTVFFKPTTSQVMLDKFATDVVYYGGMNPWESCQNSLYTLTFASAAVVKALVAGVVLMLAW